MCWRSGLTSRLIVALVFVSAAISAAAGPREQAKRLHDRLTGVPAPVATIDSMASKISAGDATGAALEAMQHPAFYNTTVREFATPWTNRDQSIYAPLNDSTATVIGMVRDNVPFDQLLYGDIVYVGGNGAVNAPYAHNSNDHYWELQANNIDLSDPQNLIQATQSGLAGSVLGPNQTAGVMTTRGFAEAFLVAGTNRAAVRFATLNFLCLDMEEMRDVTAWPDRVRQDVARSPGGDSAIFLNDCLPCHAGMDGLAGAFAYYDFNEDTQQLDYTDGVVQAKYLRDAQVFRYGFATTNDAWINYWRTGPNAYVDWSGPGSGMGAKSFGQEIAQTRRFAECQSTKVFEKVCYRSPNGPADAQAIQTLADSFQTSNHNMRTLFAETAVQCMGD